MTSRQNSNPWSNIFKRNVLGCLGPAKQPDQQNVPDKQAEQQNSACTQTENKNAADKQTEKKDEEPVPPNLICANEKLKTGKTSEGLAEATNALSNAFLTLGKQEFPQFSPMQLSPVRGPSVEQSTALAKLLETMKPKFNSGGTL